MPTIVDIVNDDAFSVASLTAAINNMDHIPGRAGELAFAGVGEGVETPTITVEVQDDKVTLLRSQPRGGTATKQSDVKRRLVPLAIPHIPDSDTILAASLMGVRQFGSTDQVAGAQAKINASLRKQAGNHDLTLEHLRLGALRGQVIDGDGTTVLADLFQTFGVAQETAVAFALGTQDTEVRTKCSAVIRKMRQNAKMTLPSSAAVHAFVDGNFMDKLVSHPTVKGVYDGYAAAERRLGESYVEGIFEFGGIFFEEYRGSDDGAVGIGANEARFFWRGVPGMYAEYYAPADYMETVGTIGLPRYAKAIPMKFDKGVEIETQQNPLPICLRPKTLMRATTN